MPLRTLHAGEGGQRVLACERFHEGFSCESGGGHACRERLPQAGLRSSHRRWAARHSLSGRTQGATARHATTPTPALLLHRAAGAPLEQIHSLFGSASQIKQGAFTAGPAAKRVALLDTRDIAATAVAALTEEGHAGKIYDLNGPELLDSYAQAAVFSSVLGRPVKYLDGTADAFIEQLKSFGLPPWMVEAFGVAVADPEIPGDQSSAEIERILQRMPGTLEQFVKDYRAAFQA